MRRIVFAIVVASFMSCGNAPSKLNNENPDGDVPVNAYEGPANSMYTPAPSPPPSGVAGVTGEGASTGPGVAPGSGDGGGGFTGGSALDQLIRAFCDYFVTCESDDIDFEFTSASQCVAAYQADPDSVLDECAQVDEAAARQCASDLQGRQCEGLLENLPQSCLQAIDYSTCNEPANSDDGDIVVVDGTEPANDTTPDCPEGTKLAEVDGEEGCYDECVEDVCESGFTCHSGLCLPDG